MQIAFRGERTTELGGGSAADGDAVKLVDVIGVLICAVDDGGSVGADQETWLHIASRGERTTELGGGSATDGDAVKLDDVMGVLICAVDDGGSVRADPES